MGRIVAIGGGRIDDITPLNKCAVEMTNKENPNVLFIPTASRDNEKYVKAIGEVFRGLGCNMRNLLLVKQSYTDEVIDEQLKWADLIYVGGGNAVYLMNVWKKYDLQQKLKSIFSANDAVIAGHGSGSLVLFFCGYSNSEYTEGKTDWQYIWMENLLDLYHVAVCPHYTGDDLFNFDKRLIEMEVPGIGLADNTALVQIDQHTEYVACKDDAKAYYLVYLNGELMKKEIRMKYLDESGQEKVIE